MVYYRINGVVRIWLLAHATAAMDRHATSTDTDVHAGIDINFYRRLPYTHVQFCLYMRQTYTVRSQGVEECINNEVVAAGVYLLFCPSSIASWRSTFLSKYIV